MNETGRKTSDRAVPSWVDPEARNFFITVCCQTRGGNQLCTPAIGSALVASARFYHEQQKWLPSIFVVMPDYVHMIVSFARGQKMEKLIQAWKRYTAIQYQIKWQRDFFDHHLRTAPTFYAKEEYILLNPVRAGLVQDTSEWPHVLRMDL